MIPTLQIQSHPGIPKMPKASVGTHRRGVRRGGRSILFRRLGSKSASTPPDSSARSPYRALLCLLVSGLWTLPSPAQETSELQAELIRLKRQNANLAESLALANKREKESSEALALVKQRLEALGKNLIDGQATTCTVQGGGRP